LKELITWQNLSQKEQDRVINVYMIGTKQHLKIALNYYEKFNKNNVILISFVLLFTDKRRYNLYNV